MLKQHPINSCQQELKENELARGRYMQTIAWLLIILLCMAIPGSAAQQESQKIRVIYSGKLTGELEACG